MAGIVRYLIKTMPSLATLGRSTNMNVLSSNVKKPVRTAQHGKQEALWSACPFLGGPYLAN